MEIRVNGINLYYESIGTGSPLIMVHGNGESHEIFYEAAEILSNYFTVYLIDSRGHGKSEKVDVYHYQDMADDIKEFIRALGLSDIVYYGFSDGGIIGLLLASQTRLCKKYILSGSNVFVDGVKPWIKHIMKLTYLFNKDPLIQLMLVEPNIKNDELRSIKDECIILAGSKDVIKEEHTKYIHESIPNSKLEILNGKTHGNYIVHSQEIAFLILKYK